MGKSTRLALMLVLFFVIGAAVLLDGKDDDSEEGKKPEMAVNSASGAAKPFWDLPQGPEAAPAGRTPNAEELSNAPERVTRAPSSGASSSERATSPGSPAGGSSSAGTYTVQSRDTLGGIARKMYGSESKWRRIFEANKDKMRSERDLKPGMVLVIPALDGSAPVASAPSPPAPPSPASRPASPSTVENGKVYHVVQRGEKLWDIAQRYYGSGVYWRTIVDLNKDQVGDGHAVRAGTRLLIGDRSQLQRAE